jgi:hypothetical protein
MVESIFFVIGAQRQRPESGVTSVFDAILLQNSR